MTIRISQVKALCTASELALVQASRRPQRDQLTLTEAKRHAVRARKLFDKWQDQSRRQSRAKSRTTGHGEVESRSTVKAEIFGDALRAFEARVAKLEAAGAKPTGGRSKNPPKTARARTHRAARAEVRADLAEAQLAANKPARKAKSTPPAPPAAEQPPAAEATGTTAPGTTALPDKPARSHKAPVPRPTNTPFVNGKKQLNAQTAAKQQRLAEKGTTNRIYGHVSARGRRAQGRRDSRN